MLKHFAKLETATIMGVDELVERYNAKAQDTKPTVLRMAGNVCDMRFLTCSYAKATCRRAGGTDAVVDDLANIAPTRCRDSSTPSWSRLTFT